MRGLEPNDMFVEQSILYKVFYLGANKVKVKAIYENKIVVLIGKNESSVIKETRSTMRNMIKKSSS